MKIATFAWIAKTPKRWMWLPPLAKCNPWLRTLSRPRPSAGATRRITEEGRLPYGAAKSSQAAKSSPYHLHISSNIIIYHSISWAHVCVLVYVYHDVSCDIMFYDITWYIVISQFVVWGLGLWSGGMISCDIIRYHVGWTTWSMIFEFGDISSYIINISCVGIMSMYHQERDMISTWYHKERKKRWYSDISCVDEGHDISWYWRWYTMIYHDSDMIYDDIWWYLV